MSRAFPPRPKHLLHAAISLYADKIRPHRSLFEENLRCKVYEMRPRPRLLSLLYFPRIKHGFVAVEKKVIELSIGSRIPARRPRALKLSQRITVSKYVSPTAAHSLSNCPSLRRAAAAAAFPVSKLTVARGLHACT